MVHFKSYCGSCVGRNCLKLCNNVQIYLFFLKIVIYRNFQVFVADISTIFAIFFRFLSLLVDMCSGLFLACLLLRVAVFIIYDILRNKEYFGIISGPGNLLYFSIFFFKSVLVSHKATHFTKVCFLDKN